MGNNGARQRSFLVWAALFSTSFILWGTFYDSRNGFPGFIYTVSTFVVLVTFVLFPVLLLRLKTSTTKLFFISLGTGLWPMVLMTGVSRVSKISLRAFEALGWIGGFFWLWSVLIAGIILVRGFSRKFGFKHGSTPAWVAAALITGFGLWRFLPRLGTFTVYRENLLWAILAYGIMMFVLYLTRDPRKKWQRLFNRTSSTSLLGRTYGWFGHERLIAIDRFFWSFFLVLSNVFFWLYIFMCFLPSSM